MPKIDRFMIRLRSGFTKAEIEQIIAGLVDVLQDLNREVKPRPPESCRSAPAALDRAPEEGSIVEAEKWWTDFVDRFSKIVFMGSLPIQNVPDMVF